MLYSCTANTSPPPKECHDLMRVALLQVASPDGETQDQRVARVEELLRAQTNADLVVLPELWSPGYFSFDRYDVVAEPLDGPTVSMCARVAAEMGVHVHVGSIVERDARGHLRNTSVLLDERGEIVQTYSKIHVFGYQSLESTLLTPGETLSVTSTRFGRVASTTCYDLRFPGLWMELSNRGVQLVIVPAAWPAARLEHWRLLSSARAVEHQIVVVACNAVGTQRGVELGGHSRVIDPTGMVIAEAGAEEQVLLADIDLEAISRVREDFPVIADRLDDYSGLSEFVGGRP